MKFLAKLYLYMIEQFINIKINSKSFANAVLTLVLVLIFLFWNQLRGKICKTVKNCFHLQAYHSFINRPLCRRICIAIHPIHWNSRGVESDDQTFEKHWINNWQTELNILYIFYQKRENSIFNIDFLTLKKHPISNLQPEFNIQVTSCKFCCVFDCNWRFLVAYFTLILFFQAVELPITQFSEDSYKKITSNLVQTPSCLWLHVHWDWRSLVGRFAPLPPLDAVQLLNLSIVPPTLCNFANLLLSLKTSISLNLFSRILEGIPLSRVQDIPPCPREIFWEYQQRIPPLTQLRRRLTLAYKDCPIGGV